MNPVSREHVVERLRNQMTYIGVVPYAGGGGSAPHRC